MAFSITPSGTTTLAKGASISLSATGAISGYSTGWERIPWIDTSLFSENSLGITKTSPSGWSGNTAVASQRILKGQGGALYCRFPAQTQRFGLIDGLGNFAIGFEFKPLASQVECIVNGISVATIAGVSNDDCEIRFGGSNVEFAINEVVLHTAPGVLTDCFYGVVAQLNLNGSALIQTEWRLDAFLDQAPEPDCISWDIVSGGGTLDRNTGNNIVYTAPLASGQKIIRVTLPNGTNVLKIINVTNVIFSSAACGSSVPAGTVVEFQANGGSSATLTAGAGTVIDSTHWLAPTIPGVYYVYYHVDNQTTSCQIQVVEKLEIEGVYNGLMDNIYPGQCLSLQANCPNVTWSSPTHSDLITAQGKFCAPNDYESDTFGGRSVTIEAAGCSQIVSFTIQVDPIYPTPDIGGPEPEKWLPLVPEYRTLVREQDGGCGEYYLLNDEPIQRWQLTYRGLSLCPTQESETPPPGFKQLCAVDYTDRPFTTSQGFANRLDKFWKLVKGQTRPFWYRDQDGNLWPKVHFDGLMTRNHDRYETEQSREVKLVFRPCCEIISHREIC